MEKVTREEYVASKLAKILEAKIDNGKDAEIEKDVGIDKEDISEAAANRGDVGTAVVKANNQKGMPSEIIDFAMTTSEKMKDLGILSLNITQNPKEITLMTAFET